MLNIDFKKGTLGEKNQYNLYLFMYIHLETCL